MMLLTYGMYGLSHCGLWIHAQSLVALLARTPFMHQHWQDHARLSAFAYAATIVDAVH